MMGRLAGLVRPGEARRRAAELLERFELAEAGWRIGGDLVGGMRRRLDLAASLVGRPSVIFSTSRPPASTRSRQAMWQVVADLAARGDHLPHHPVPGGGRLAGRPHRCARRRAGRRRHRGAQAPVAGQRLDLVLADALAFDEVGRRPDGRVVQRLRVA